MSTPRHYLALRRSQDLVPLCADIEQRPRRWVQPYPDIAHGMTPLSEPHARAWVTTRAILARLLGRLPR